jgi:hypothetical protein
VPVAVKLMGLPTSVPDVAVTVLVPAVEPSVRVLNACPLESEETCEAESNPPPAVTANATLTPETAVPFASVTLTTNGAAKGCPAVPLWLFPLSAVMVFAGPAPVATPVAVKVMGLPAKAPPDAVTVLAPTVDPSTRTVDARPRELVTPCVVCKVPPPAMIVNVTAVPETGFPEGSVTLTVKGADNAWPGVPVCPLPLTSTKVAAGPADVVPPPPEIYAFTLKFAAVRPAVPVAIVML